MRSKFIAVIEVGARGQLQCLFPGLGDHEGRTARRGGTWTFTGGTGKLKGIKGKGTYKDKGAADGSGTIEVEGEYELPK